MRCARCSALVGPEGAHGHVCSANVLSALERDRREMWNAKYGEARGLGFAPADARLHADQALELHDRQLKETTTPAEG